MLWFVVLLGLYDVVTTSVVKFDSCCKSPEVTSRSLYEDVYKNSPYYVIAVPRTPKTELIDNICYTYFENDRGELLNAISVVFKNGASEQYFFSADDFGEDGGISLSRGPGCSFLDYSLDQICCDDVLILYRCFVNSDSCSDLETDIGCIPAMDVRLAMANTPHINCDCTDCLLGNLMTDNRFCGNDFILLPNLLCPQCVTEYNCKDAVRADCAAGEICVKDCCRLTPHVSNPLPTPLLPPPPPHIPVNRRYPNPLHHFFG